MAHEELVAALRKTPPTRGMLTVKPDAAMKDMADRSVKRTEKDKSKRPVAGARMAPDGLYYVPDPSRPGKYLQVNHGEERETGSHVGS